MHTWRHRIQSVTLSKQDELAQKMPRTETKQVRVGIMGGQKMADWRHVGCKAGSTGQEK